MITVDEYIDAMRVPDSVQARHKGLWEVRRVQLRELGLAQRLLYPYTSLTSLLRMTDETVHTDSGECVMDDSPLELRRHMPILMRARGRVLITGLGLGCVVRGLLLKPEVTRIDVVEIDAAVITLTGKSVQHDPRVRLWHADALTWRFRNTLQWDYAWHDVWSEPGKPHLDELHARLLWRYHKNVRVQQGAWQMNRMVKRLLPQLLNTARRYQRRYQAPRRAGAHGCGGF